MYTFGSMLLYLSLSAQYSPAWGILYTHPVHEHSWLLWSHGATYLQHIVNSQHKRNIHGGHFSNYRSNWHKSVPPFSQSELAIFHFQDLRALFSRGTSLQKGAETKDFLKRGARHGRKHDILHKSLILENANHNKMQKCRKWHRALCSCAYFRDCILN